MDMFCALKNPLQINASLIVLQKMMMAPSAVNELYIAIEYDSALSCGNVN